MAEAQQAQFRWRRGALVAMTAAMFLVIMGSTVPSGLFARYQDAWGLDETATSYVFAMYAVGVLAALALCGHLADAIGRLPVVLAAVGTSVVSSVVFVFASNEPGLYLARLLSGVSVGLATGSFTAALRERTTPKLGALISTVVTSSALAVGPVYSALVADASGAPLTAPYISYGAATALSFVFVALCREVYRPPNERRLAPRVGVPRSILKRFAPNATAVFCAYGTNALFQSLIPLAMIVFGATSQLEMALATAVMLGTSAITQVAVINYGGSRSLAVGLVVLAVGLVGMAVSLVGVFPALFWVATVICGVGQGVSFKASLANAVDSALPGDEARTTSMYYLVAYLGTGVPPVIAGLLGGGAAAVSAVAAVVAIIAVATIGYLRAAGQLGYRHG